jgi:hypothetical protein
MRSLNTSLPSTRPPPPERLLQAFKTAALSVTNLYKSAATDQNASRQFGYQEALADLLSFLDRENLGLQDGEGWRVRQWATELYDGSAVPQQNESDEERSEGGQRPRSTSPTQEQPAAAEEATQSAPTEPTLPAILRDPIAEDRPASAPIFTFSGNNNTISSDDMQTEEVTSSQPSASIITTNRATFATNRGNRTRSGQRQNTKSSVRDFTFNAGTKRKFPMPDFFDISNLNPDGSSSSKKGRLS